MVGTGGDEGTHGIGELESVLEDLYSVLPDKEAARAALRALFVRARLKGYGMDEVCDILNISRATGYNWQDAWLEEGIGSLEADFHGGRRCLLTQEQLMEFADEADRLKMTTAEARAFVKARYGVSYTAKQIDHHLRGQGLRHVRPYEIDFGSEEESEHVMAGSSLMRWTRRWGLGPDLSVKAAAYKTIEWHKYHDWPIGLAKTTDDAIVGAHAIRLPFGIAIGRLRKT